MPISTDLSNNKIVTAELVRTVWDNYISKFPTFLSAVTLHVETVENPGGAGVFRFIVPNYFIISAIANAFDDFPYAYTEGSYYSPVQEVKWDQSNIRVHRYNVRQYDQALLMNNQEYKMNFIESVLIKLLLDFEQDFANILQGKTLNQTTLDWDDSFNKWPVIVPFLPKTDWASSTDGSTYEAKAKFWYDSFYYLSVINTSYEIPALGFIPSISDLGGWTLETCSQYAKYLNLKNAQLACTPAVMQAICSEYAIASSTSSLIGSWKYNTQGNAIGNGLVNAYTLPSLQVTLDPMGWTQGIMFSIVDIQYDSDSDIYTLDLICVTREPNIPADNMLYISKSTPMILGMKRYTPTADVSEYSYETPYSFDLGNWATINSIEDNVYMDIHNTSFISLRVSGPQLTLPGSSVFPLLNTLQYPNVTLTLPWRSHDFNTVVTTADFKCTHTGPLTWHTSYLHSKDSTHVFAVKQRDVGGGIVSKEEDIDDKIPFKLFEQGKVLDGENQVTAQGIMAHGVIPQLGGKFLAWSPYLKLSGL